MLTIPNVELNAKESASDILQNATFIAGDWGLLLVSPSDKYMCFIFI